MLPDPVTGAAVPALDGAAILERVPGLDQNRPEELRREGWVREFIRSVQDIRKEQGLAYDARIEVAFQTPSDELAAVIAQYQAAIAGEVLATAITPKDALPSTAKTANIDQHALTLHITQA